MNETPAWVPKRGAHTVVWDLDSTICDTRHRRHLMPELADWQTPGAWDEYSRNCAGDTPIEGAVRLFQVLQSGHTMMILSARAGLPEVYRATHRWLHNCGVRRYSRLLLRPPGSPLGPTEWKKIRLKMLIDEGHEIDLAIDDHPGCAEAFASLGVPTLVVTPPGAYDLAKAHL